LGDGDAGDAYEPLGVAVATLAKTGSKEAVPAPYRVVVGVAGEQGAMEAAATAAFFSGITRVVDASGIKPPLEGWRFSAAVGTAVSVARVYRFRWVVLILLVLLLLKLFRVF